MPCAGPAVTLYVSVSPSTSCATSAIGAGVPARTIDGLILGRRRVIDGHHGDGDERRTGIGRAVVRLVAEGVDAAGIRIRRVREAAIRIERQRATARRLHEDGRQAVAVRSLSLASTAATATSGVSSAVV